MPRRTDNTQSFSDGTKLHLAIVNGSGSVMCAASLGMWRVFQGEGIEISGGRFLICGVF